MSLAFNIAFVESSEVIAEGIISLLGKSIKNFNISWFTSFENFKNSFRLHHYEVIIINPLLIFNIEEDWNKLFSSTTEIFSIALVYQHFNDDMLVLFSEKYSINQPISALIKLIHKTEKNIKKENQSKGYLSAREKEILKFLSQGKSIKEIAEIVHLSPHTVLTHRKNISAKTGIKTVAGLTVYAISLGLINIDEMNL